MSGVDFGIELLLGGIAVFGLSNLVLMFLPPVPPLYRGLTDEPEDWQDDDAS